jgi:SAM-dependent methyltransferase
MVGPDIQFWQQRFESKQTGWDRGQVSPQLMDWLNNGSLQPCKILIPGCGSGWEVIELAKRGFDVTALDYTPAAVAITQARLKELQLTATVIQADALEFSPPLAFDAIYEQTCLCAIHPEHWQRYVSQLHRWLKPSGSLWILFMQMVRPKATEEGFIEGPPYHCDINAMRALFTESLWEWPKPPYAKVPHPNLSHELALRLIKRT